MKSITLINNTSRNTYNVEGTKTVRELLDDKGITTSGQTFHLNGVPLSTDELDKTFAELITGEEAMLVVIVAQKSGM